MPSNQEITQEIKTLCIFYKQSMVFNGTFLNKLNTKQFAKIEILEEIDKAKNTSQILAILQKPCQVSGLKISNEAYLRKSGRHWGSWLLITLLILLLFPIAVPILMISSRIKRGSFNFIRPGGAFLVDKILLLCQSLPDEKNNKNSRTGASKNLSQMNASLRPLSMPVSYPSQASVNSTFSATVRSPTMPKSIHFLSKYSGAGELEEIETGNKKAEQEAIALAASAPAQRNLEESFSGMNQLFARFEDTFFANMAQHNRKEQTGKPLISSYRINDSQPDDKTFSIDIKWKFMWTNHPSIRLTFPLLKSFELPLDYRPVPKAAITTPTNPPALLEQARSWLSSFFSEDFNSLLTRAKNTKGIFKKEAIYKTAYALADTIPKRMAVLENLITELDDYYHYLTKLWCRDNDTLKRDLWYKKTTDKINYYLSLLPDNYPLTRSAKLLSDQLQEVIELVQANEVDKAWELYEPIPWTNYFVRRTFPNLEAMHHQLYAIFRITCHNQDYTESQILRCLLHNFTKMSESLNTYDQDKRVFIDQEILDPLNSLIPMGQQATRNMSPELSQMIYDSERERAHWLRAQGISIFFRKPNESMDDDEARVVKLDSPH